ncbi:MAG: hypothetical protein GMKNLPBB_01848 [Myxococcota bacterium]|nr:hypothetical protein [Myxococcota bacterium]
MKACWMTAAMLAWIGGLAVPALALDDDDLAGATTAGAAAPARFAPPPRITGPLPYFMRDDAAIEQDIIAITRAKPRLIDRFTEYSGRLRHTPYRFSPMGEAAGVDPDPLWNVQETDCLAFVETVLALANASSLAGARQLLNDIRYSNGKPEFASRNHFMEAQWIPANIKKGYVRDITRQIGGDRVIWASKSYTREAWEKRRNPHLIPLEWEQVPHGVAGIPVIPLDAFPELLPRIPHGAIVSIVRADYYSIPNRISHLGIVVAGREKNSRIFRHATKVWWNRVIDAPMEAYIERLKKTPQWPVTGLHIMLPVEREAVSPAARKTP